MYVLVRVSDFIYFNFRTWECCEGNVFALPFKRSSFPVIWTVKTLGPLAFNGWPVYINLNICLRSFIRRSPQLSGRKLFLYTLCSKVLEILAPDEPFGF